MKNSPAATAPTNEAYGNNPLKSSTTREVQTMFDFTQDPYYAFLIMKTTPTPTEIPEYLRDLAAKNKTIAHVIDSIHKLIVVTINGEDTLEYGAMSKIAELVETSPANVSNWLSKYPSAYRAPNKRFYVPLLDTLRQLISENELLDLDLSSDLDLDPNISLN